MSVALIVGSVNWGVESTEWNPSLSCGQRVHPLLQVAFKLQSNKFACYCCHTFQYSLSHPAATNGCTMGVRSYNIVELQYTIYLHSWETQTLITKTKWRCFFFVCFFKGIVIYFAICITSHCMLRGYLLLIEATSTHWMSLTRVAKLTFPVVLWLRCQSRRLDV